MQIAVHLAAPVGAFADIVDNPVISNPFFVQAVAVVAAQLRLGDRCVGGRHVAILAWCCGRGSAFMITCKAWGKWGGLKIL